MDTKKDIKSLNLEELKNLGLREPDLVLRTPVAGWHMQGLSAAYVVWLEILSWVLIDSDRCYFSDMKTWSLPYT